jgi:peroxiredoxin
VGDKAPDLSLQTLDGKQINLADFLPKGPVVIVELRGWVGYQCPICNRQVGELIGDSKQILSKASQVILIYPGPEEGLTDQALGTHAQDFIAGKGLPDGFSFVTDPQMKVVNAWGLRWDKPRETAYPATFVIDKNGIVQFAKISHSHGNRATAAEVNAALDALK